MRSTSSTSHRRIAALTSLLFVSTSTMAIAQTTEPEAGTASGASSPVLHRLLVVGSAADASRIAGSAHVISDVELERFNYEDINRVLRRVPGVNLQEEDGYGLRPNIGIRGTGIERSEKITLMEDGVLIAPAPYAAPAAYYFPVAGRMEGVEVRKGSSAIKFGPRTVGGSINLLSTSIPETWSGHAEARFGSDDYRQMHLYGGGSGDMFGVLMETYQAETDGFKQLDNGGDTGFDIEDYVVKARVNTPEGARLYQALELKLSYYDQTSDETYLGLTDDDFAATPYRRYAGSARDQMNAEHKQVQATHFIELGDRVDVTTVGYYNEFERNWFKLDSVDLGSGSVGISSILGDPQTHSDILAVLRGEADSPDDALNLRNNARQYYSWGIQSVVGLGFDMGDSRHDLSFSVRYHEDEEDRLQHDEHFRMDSGTMVSTSEDAIGSNANREAKAEAWAFYVEDEISLGRWTVTPGLRYENIDLVRLDYSTTDPTRAGGPTRVRESGLDVFIPGIGATYDLNDAVVLLAGVHRGFSPTSPGDTDSKEELSTNYEAGVRYDDGLIQASAIAFFSDYSNLLGTCTNATGCTGADIGDQFNAGKVDVWGAELSLGADLGPVGDAIVAVPVYVSYTLTDAEFQTDFSDSFWGDVMAGDSLPYIPRHQFYASAGVEGAGWGLNMAVSAVSKTRASAGQGDIPASDKIDGRVVVDLSGDVNITEGAKLFGTVHNLFDATYSVARRPAGLRPGKPRTFTAGLKVDF